MPRVHRKLPERFRRCCKRDTSSSTVAIVINKLALCVFRWNLANLKKCGLVKVCCFGIGIFNYWKPDSQISDLTSINAMYVHRSARAGEPRFP